MEEKPATIPWDEATFQRYQTIRNEIGHEDNLVGIRLNWFTASQSFLLTALAIAHQGGTHLPDSKNNFFFPLVPLLAISSCLLILIGVIGGIGALRSWRKMLNETIPDAFWLPKLQKDRWIILFGLITPILLPVVFLGAWTFLLFAGLTEN